MLACICERYEGTSSAYQSVNELSRAEINAAFGKFWFIPHSFGFTGAPFAHEDILEAQSSDVVGNLVELKEGTFILERIVVPEATVNDDAPFDINFIVDKHDSSLLLDSSVEQLASAAFCKVHYVGDISDASIIIDGLDDNPNAVTKVKADAGHIWICVRTKF